jgi:hypothetical protein
MARSETAFLDEGEGKPIVLVHGFASNKEVHWIYHGWVSALMRAERRAGANVKPQSRWPVLKFAFKRLR